MRNLLTFNGRLVQILLMMLIVIMGFNPANAADICDKKPELPKCSGIDPEPDPDPGNPGAACADSESFFPAFAYVFTGEILLSNSAGDCSFPIYNADGTMMGVPTSFSYRLYDTEIEDVDEGKIVWTQRDPADDTVMNVLLAEFVIEAGVITTPIPIVPRVIFQEPVGYGSIMQPDLHPDGNKVIVSAFQVGEEEGWIWEFNIPDADSGPAQNFEILAHRNVSDDAEQRFGDFMQPLYGMSLMPERVYFGLFTGSSYPYKTDLLYIEKDTETSSWSEPVLIRQGLDGDLGPGSMAEWEYDQELGVREVMAYTNTIDGTDFIEILDVEECVNNTDRCVVVDGIEGWDGPQFTTFTEGPLPALLYLYDVDVHNVGYSIRECELTSLPDCPYRTVIDGIKNPKRTLFGVDSAD